MDQYLLQFSDFQKTLHIIKPGQDHFLDFYNPLILSPYSLPEYDTIIGVPTKLTNIDKKKKKKKREYTYNVSNGNLKSVKWCIKIPEIKIKKKYRNKIRISLRNNFMDNIIIKSYAIIESLNIKIPGFNKEILEIYKEFFSEKREKKLEWQYEKIQKEKIYIKHPWFFIGCDRDSFPIDQVNGLDLIYSYNLNIGETLCMEKRLKKSELENSENSEKLEKSEEEENWEEIDIKSKYLLLKKKEKYVKYEKEMEFEIPNIYIEKQIFNKNYLNVVPKNKEINMVKININKEILNGKKNIIEIKGKGLIIGIIISLSNESTLAKWISIKINNKGYMYKYPGIMLGKEITRKIKPLKENIYMILFSDPFNTEDHYGSYSGIDIGLNKIEVTIKRNKEEKEEVKIGLLEIKKIGLEKEKPN